MGPAPKGRDRAPGQQQGHLVPADATHHVVVASGLHEQVSQLDEHLVPAWMSVAVVDRLEGVDVEKDQGRPLDAV